MLTPDRSGEAGTLPIDDSSREQPTLGSSFNQQAVKARSCMKSEKVRSGLKVRFERSPSPDLFSDDEPVVPGRGFSTTTDQSPERVVGPSEEFVESWCPEVVVMEDIGVDLTPKSSETADEGEDLCVVVGQVRPQTSYSVPLRIQGSPIEAVVDTGAEVSVLGKMFYDQLEQKPHVKRQVTLLQAGHGARLKGFVADPFDFRVGRHTHRVDLYVAPL